MGECGSRYAMLRRRGGEGEQEGVAALCSPLTASADGGGVACPSLQLLQLSSGWVAHRASVARSRAGAWVVIKDPDSVAVSRAHFCCHKLESAPVGFRHGGQPSGYVCALRSAELMWEGRR